MNFTEHHLLHDSITKITKLANIADHTGGFTVDNRQNIRRFGSDI